MQLNTDRCVFRQQYWKYGKTDCAACLVSQGADVNRANGKGNTPLHYAAMVSESVSAIDAIEH